jgi:hypothetical protein
MVLLKRCVDGDCGCSRPGAVSYERHDVGIAEQIPQILRNQLFALSLRNRTLVVWSLAVYRLVRNFGQHRISWGVTQCTYVSAGGCAQRGYAA